MNRKTYKNDLFISYAHLDNKPLPGNEDGWITLFHKTLEFMLSGRIGREPEIWRDKKLAGNDDFAAEIVDQFPETALLISVVSPRYVRSEWCTKEVNAFCDSAGGAEKVTGNKSRILKVVKFPDVDEKPLPEVMKKALGYQFYIIDDQQTPRELDPAYGAKFKEKWLDQISRVAVDVAQLIKALDAGLASADSSNAAAAAATSQATGAAAQASKPVVYVADCSSDRREDRNAIIAELRAAGYPILPKEKLPDDENGFVRELDAVLRRCKLSVHIAGSGYGVVLDGPSEKSVSVLANERAIQCARDSGLKRIIWVPSGTESQSEKQRLFIQALLEDAEAQYGADVIDGSIEDLKRAMHDGLRKIEAPEAPPSNKPALFLADCSFDRRDDREAVIADLRSDGYPILPDMQLPTEEASYFGALATVLGRCKLSVHIIGSNYGVVPDGPSERSVSVLANELTVEYSKRVGLKRIIWLPSGSKSNSKRQQEFIDSLKTDPAATFGAEVVTGSVDDLKAAIRDTLKKFEAPEIAQPAQQPTAPRKVIYLICDEVDREATMPLRIFLRKQGFDTRVPAFKGDAATVRQSNLDLLNTCDQAIIFYGVKEDSWKRSVDAEILKSAGGRTKPPLEPFAYLAQPETEDKKELIELEEPRIINCLSGFSEPALAEFVDTVAGKPKP